MGWHLGLCDLGKQVSSSPEVRKMAVAWRVERQGGSGVGLRLVPISEESWYFFSAFCNKGLNETKQENGNEIVNDEIINVILRRYKLLERDMSTVGGNLKKDFSYIVKEKWRVSFKNKLNYIINSENQISLRIP